MLSSPGAFQHDEQGIALGGRTLPVEVVGHGREEPWRDRDQTLASSLAGRDEDTSFADTQILETQPEDLASARPAKQHRVGHRPITSHSQRRDQRINCRRGQHPRKRARCAHHRKATTSPAVHRATSSQTARDNIHRDVRIATDDEIVEKATNTRQAPGNSPCRQTGLAVQANDVAAQSRPALNGKKLEDVSRRHPARRLADDLEEDLQV